MQEKNLELERMVFFSDAIVAIAITLLALDLKIEPATHGHLTFSDLFNAWHKFVAFFLSFFIIAVFWKIHHEFYVYIRKIDKTFLWYNIGWLMFIVMLPFTSSLVSSYFDTASVFCYSINVLFITIFQNMIWDYVAVRRSTHLKESTSDTTVRDYRISCNIAMLNAIGAAALSFLAPFWAFLFLLTRLPAFTITARIYRLREAKKARHIRAKRKPFQRK